MKEAYGEVSILVLILQNGGAYKVGYSWEDAKNRFGVTGTF